jgi:hypothetical protein
MAFDSASPSTIIIGNSVRDTPMDPLVPQYLEDSSALVEKYLGLNEAFATTAFADAQAAMAALAYATFPQNIPNPPEPPLLTTSAAFSTGIALSSAPGLANLDTTAPTAFTPDIPDIPDFSDEIPTYVPIITGISIPDPPSVVPITLPTTPTIDTEFDVPDAPTPDYGTAPTLTEFDLPVFVPPVLPFFGEDAPTFDETPPSPVIQWAEPVYQSDIQDLVKDVLAEMLAGGTGLPAAVELAIWERGREREDERSEQEIEAAIAQWTTRGFSHPPGQLNSQTIVLRDMTGRKVNELSREVMVAQAQLEQKNRQFAVQYGVDYEKVFTNVFLQVVERNFQIAKFTVETQVQIFNMLVTAFNVEQQIYAQKILKYKTDAEAAFLEVRAFEAEVGAVKAGAELNVALTQVYGERVRAYQSQVSAYGETVRAAVARADLQKNKVELYKAQIDGVVAEVTLQRETFVAYSAKIQGESAKVGLEEANTRAYTARVQAIGERASILFKQADANIAKDRLRLDWNIANMQRITTMNGQQVALGQQRLSAYDAQTREAIARFQANLGLSQAEVQSSIELGRLQISKYDVLTRQWQAKVQELISMAEINAGSLRAAGQIASNLAAGALAGIHVSAGLSAAGQATQSSSRQVSDHTGHAEGYNSGYNVNHNYAHKV